LSADEREAASPAFGNARRSRSFVLEPPERSLPGGESLVKVGEDVSEHFDYRPACIVRVVRPNIASLPKLPVLQRS
jgi:transposase